MKIMKQQVMTVAVVGMALMTVAMPKKQELDKAQELVNEVTASYVKAVRAGTMRPTEAAAKCMELAARDVDEAEKYLLLRRAFRLFVKAGDYDAAADVLGEMNRKISNMDPEEIIDIYSKTISGSMREKSPKLFAIKEAARRQVLYRKELAKAEAAVKANPANVAAQRNLGECQARLGNWQKALDAFAKADGDLSKMAKAELDGALKPQEIADFWWSYSDGSAYRLHAAELYRTALADSSFNGLARARAEQRVKETEPQDDQPRIVRISPANGANDVDPKTDKIVITFSEEMADRSWAYCPTKDGSKDDLPKNSGMISYDASHTVLTIPVELVPGKNYKMQFNDEKFRFFKSKAGKPLKEYPYSFTTKAQ